jgi:hypothetical protein
MDQESVVLCLKALSGIISYRLSKQHNVQICSRAPTEHNSGAIFFFFYFFFYSCCSLLEQKASVKRSFHVSFLILDSRWASLDGKSARRKAAT